MSSLMGKTAIVTGASRGIGRAIALRLAEAGADIAAVARSTDSVKDTVTQIQALGRKAQGYGVDVADSAAVENVVKQIEADFTTVHILVNNAGQANYAASKAGMIGFSRSVAREFASRGITCNVVCPGFIDTDMTKVLPEELKTKLLQNIPLQRLGKVEDIAGAVEFLAGPSADYITGQVLTVDGGMVM
jgi:3-oxoacyl-[acyl-carrier protein] reductase